MSSVSTKIQNALTVQSLVQICNSLTPVRAQKMKDRLDELRSLQTVLQNDLLPENEEIKIGEGQRPLSSNANFLERFYCVIEETESNINDLALQVTKLKIKQDTILADPCPEGQAKEELNNIIAVINEKTTSIRNSLKSIAGEIEQDIEKEAKWKQELKQDYAEMGLTRSLTGDSAELRIKKSQCAKVFQEFNEVMSEYNDARSKYSKMWKSRLTRQFALIGKTVSDDELDEMLENKKFSVFTQGILITETQQTEQSLRDLKATHEEIIQLEKSINQLHELFMDMAFIVESQGALVDNIEHNVQNAMEYISIAKSELDNAIIYHDKNRKKKIFLTIFCLLLVGIIVLAIIVLAVDRPSR